MSLSEQTLTALQTLMAQDSALLAQVQGAEDAAHAATSIVSAAAQKGIVITQAELVTYFQQTAQGAAEQALSDAQLEAIAGGLNQHEFNAISMFSLGVGCLVLSATSRCPGHGEK